MRVWALDNHVARRIHKYARRVTRVQLHKPDNNWDVVGNAAIRHRNCAVGLEEVDGAAVVVRESGGFGLKRRVGIGERNEVLADQPLDIFRVWEG